jgi:hypothetical protein
MPAFLTLFLLGQAAAPAAAATLNVAFCVVRDRPGHDYLSPTAPAGTDLDARFEEWLKATLPSLPPERLKKAVQCDPSVPRSVYDHWFGVSHLTSGDVLGEPLAWPRDWYLRHPPLR